MANFSNPMMIYDDAWASDVRFFFKKFTNYCRLFFHCRANFHDIMFSCDAYDYWVLEESTNIHMRSIGAISRTQRLPEVNVVSAARNVILPSYLVLTLTCLWCLLGVNLDFGGGGDFCQL